MSRILLDAFDSQGSVIIPVSIVEATSATSSEIAYLKVIYYGNGNTGGTPPTDSNLYLSGDLVTVLTNSGSLIKVA